MPDNVSAGVRQKKCCHHCIKWCPLLQKPSDLSCANKPLFHDAIQWSPPPLQHMWITLCGSLPYSFTTTRSQSLHAFRPLPSATVFPCYYKPIVPCHAVVLCASKRVIATLDHLREWESNLPLPQPTSISVAEIFYVTWLWQHRTWTVCSISQESKTESLKWWFVNGITKSPRVKIRSATHQNRTMTMGCMALLQLGRLRRPSTTRVTGSLGYSPRATDASQKSAGCEGWVHQFAAYRSEVQKGQTLPLWVWVARPQVNWGRPRARLLLPGSSRSAEDGAFCPMLCRCWSRALHSVSRTERSKFQGTPSVFRRRSRARQRVPQTRHSCEVSRRASSLANDK